LRFANSPRSAATLGEEAPGTDNFRLFLKTRRKIEFIWNYAATLSIWQIPTFLLELCGNALNLANSDLFTGTMRLTCPPQNRSMLNERIFDTLSVRLPNLGGFA